MPIYPLRELQLRPIIEEPLGELFTIYCAVLNHKLVKANKRPMGRQNILGAILADFLLTNRENILNDYDTLQHSQLAGIARALLEGAAPSSVSKLRVPNSRREGIPQSYAETFLQALRTATRVARRTPLPKRSRAAAEILRGDQAPDDGAPPGAEEVRRAK